MLRLSKQVRLFAQNLHYFIKNNANLMNNNSQTGKLITFGNTSIFSARTQ